MQPSARRRANRWLECHWREARRSSSLRLVDLCASHPPLALPRLRSAIRSWWRCFQRLRQGQTRQSMTRLMRFQLHLRPASLRALAMQQGHMCLQSNPHPPAMRAELICWRQVPVNMSNWTCKLQVAQVRLPDPLWTPRHNRCAQMMLTCWIHVSPPQAHCARVRASEMDTAVAAVEGWRSVSTCERAVLVLPLPMLMAEVEPQARKSPLNNPCQQASRASVHLQGVKAVAWLQVMPSESVAEQRQRSWMAQWVP